MNKQRCVVFTGSGISAPSGLATFRDPDGIWSRYSIEEVATPEAWQADPEKVLEFYNLRRIQLGQVKPNRAHTALVELEEIYEVTVITQNVDDLHERAGSSMVLHLHGELTKVRSSVDPSLVYDVGYSEIGMGELCEKDSQLRPHVVWFGEEVQMLAEAANYFHEADLVIVAGTSLRVYPAAGLVELVPPEARRYIVDTDTTIAPAGFSLLCGSADEVLPTLTHQLVAS